MSKYMETAKALRADPDVHYNCAQAALIPFAEDAGLSKDTAMRIAANFGSGMKRASVCGAITGGLMVLGLYGAEDPATVQAYYSRLKENHEGCLDCADLLRINKERGGAKKPHCDEMVFECVALAEEILREQGKLD